MLLSLRFLSLAVVLGSVNFTTDQGVNGMSSEWGDLLPQCSSWTTGSEYGDCMRTPNDKPTSVYSSGLFGSSLDVFGYHNTKYDTALMYVVNNLPMKIAIWGQSAECYTCDYMKLDDVAGNTTRIFQLDTWWEMTLAVTRADNVFVQRVALCSLWTNHFGENGNYSLYINLNKTDDLEGAETCVNSTIKQPDNAFIPIYVATGVYALLALSYGLVNFAYMNGAFGTLTNWCAMERVVNSDLGSPPLRQPITNNINLTSKDKAKPRRLKSLDAFRGLSIVIMIFVNHGGGGYWFFKHSRWNGLTVADLVFPWFVFIMGTSMALSFSSMIRHNVSRTSMMKKIIRRTIILFGLGIVLDSGMDLSTFRIPGVLQRFAISYLVVASLHCVSAKPRLEDYRIANKYHQMFRDLVDFWHEWLVIIPLIILYICLLFFLPVPGCPVGYMGPGGPLIENGSLINCTGGVTGYIDRWILGEKHLYSHPTAMKVYHTTLNYDPEGILGSIPSIFITFLGLQAGKILLLHQYHSSRIFRLLIWSTATTHKLAELQYVRHKMEFLWAKYFCESGLSVLLCEASKEEGWIPINKNLWSLSFVLAMGGLSFLLLMFCYITIDMKQWWSGVPFVFAGMNPITLYCGHEILMNRFPFSWTPVVGTHAELLAMSLLCSSLWVGISYYMYTINFFVKI